jgi:hypothetical protein
MLNSKNHEIWLALAGVRWRQFAIGAILNVLIGDVEKVFLTTKDTESR